MSSLFFEKSSKNLYVSGYIPGLYVGFLKDGVYKSVQLSPILNYCEIFLSVCETYTNPAEAFSGMSLTIHTGVHNLIFIRDKNKESFYIFGYAEDHFRFLKNILKKVN